MYPSCRPSLINVHVFHYHLFLTVTTNLFQLQHLDYTFLPNCRISLFLLQRCDNLPVGNGWRPLPHIPALSPSSIICRHPPPPPFLVTAADVAFCVVFLEVRVVMVFFQNSPQPLSRKERPTLRTSVKFNQRSKLLMLVPSTESSFYSAPVNNFPAKHSTTNNISLRMLLFHFTYSMFFCFNINSPLVNNNVFSFIVFLAFYFNLKLFSPGKYPLTTTSLSIPVCLIMESNNGVLFLHFHWFPLSDNFSVLFSSCQAYPLDYKPHYEIL